LCGSPLRLSPQRNTAQRSATQHNTAQRSTTQHNTTQHSAAQHNTTQHNTAQRSATQHSTTQRNTAQHSTAQRSTTQHSTTQHNIQRLEYHTAGTIKSLNAFAAGCCLFLAQLCTTSCRRKEETNIEKPKDKRRKRKLLCFIFFIS
jgi:hypothetical protein